MTYNYSIRKLGTARRLAVTLCAGIMAALPVFADPSSDEVVKFEQVPMIDTFIEDRSYFGHDEESRAGRMEAQMSTNIYLGSVWMADDFADHVSADIVHVEWWGSYIGSSEVAPPPSFLIEFLSDFPDQDGPGTNSWSRPETNLLAQIVDYTPAPGHPAPGYYTEAIVPETAGNPEPVYHYNAHLRIPFSQKADTVYWLKIVALVDFPYDVVWGWHSRDYTVMNEYASTNVFPGERVVGSVGVNSTTPVWHFQDNAVVSGPIWIFTVTNGLWEEVVDVQENEIEALPTHFVGDDGPPDITNYSQDLAFRLFYRPDRPSEPKWDKPLDTEQGFDISSSLSEVNETYVADDFVSDGRPITGFRWWGSYLGYENETNGPVNPPAGNGRPDAFFLEWWTDVPAGVDGPYSHPGTMIESQWRELTPGGAVTEEYYTSIWHVAKGWVHEFVYDYTVTDYHDFWNEKRDEIYWLGIQADYGSRNPSNEWGWATTSLRNGWHDGAVSALSSRPYTNWAELRYNEECSGHAYGTNAVNMAFALNTHVVGRRALKWRQPPDMVYGENLSSWQINGENASWPLRAEDFISDGRRITDIHWWGSYLGYKTNWVGEEGPYPAAPSNSASPLGFRLSWHHDIPTNSNQSYSMPSNPPIREFFVPMEKCHEVFYGTVMQFWKTGGVPPLYQEHEYQYYVDLLDPDLEDLGGPWPEVSNVIYWLNIQAVFTNTWSPSGQPHDGWGWKTTPLSNRWNDASVLATPLGPPFWEVGRYPPDHFYQGEPAADLAFELTTDEVGSSVWHTPITITNIVRVNSNTFLVVSEGDPGSGVQVLQKSVDLTTNIWIDLQTNQIPLSPPFPNLWYRITDDSNEFFRVIAR